MWTFLKKLQKKEPNKKFIGIEGEVVPIPLAQWVWMLGGGGGWVAGAPVLCVS
jgi:hypothetical protein